MRERTPALLAVLDAALAPRRVRTLLAGRPAAVF